MKSNKKNKYIKYTKAELEGYTRDEDSCVRKIHSSEHFGVPVSGLADLQVAIRGQLDRKIGRFDRIMEGIVLDIRNAKVEQLPSVIRYDSAATVHLNVASDFYVFRPQIGAIVKGVVKHISREHIGVVIYRVFNVAVKIAARRRINMQVNAEIKIKMLNFDLETHLPEIEGEIVEIEEEHDSGIGTEDHQIAVKEEPVSSDASSSGVLRSIKKKRPEKRVSFMDLPDSEPDEMTQISVKQEPTDHERKKKKKRDEPEVPAPIKIKSEKESEPEEPEVPAPIRIKSEPSSERKKKKKRTEPEEEPEVPSPIIKSEPPETKKKKKKRDNGEPPVPAPIKTEAEIIKKKTKRDKEDPEVPAPIIIKPEPEMTKKKKKQIELEIPIIKPEPQSDIDEPHKKKKKKNHNIEPDSAPRKRKRDEDLMPPPRVKQEVESELESSEPPRKKKKKRSHLEDTVLGIFDEIESERE